MRQKRTKAYRKLMAMYSRSYGFRQPYQVLIDATLCSETVAMKLELVKQLGTVLDGTVKPMITQCCIVELYKLGHAQQLAVDLAKSFERRKCNHREAIPGDECLASVVGPTNKHRYVIASQSQPLRAQLRAVPGVPLVHVTRAVMILEPASDETMKQKDAAENKALLPSAAEAAQLAQAEGADPPRKKKRKGPKGPNPLSVKKKQSKPQGAAAKSAEAQPAQQVGEKRKRSDEDGNADDAAIVAGKHKRRRKSENVAEQ